MATALNPRMDDVAEPSPSRAPALTALWADIEAAGPLDDPFVEVDWAAAANALDGGERIGSQADRRRTFIAHFSWAVPTPAAIAAIATFVEGRTVLEVGAGHGLWAYLLGTAGVITIATDGQPPAIGAYVPITRQDAEAAVHIHSECAALLLVWPPFRDDCAARALHAFGGDRLVVIGDPRFTADARFHQMLAEEWTLHERRSLPSWPGLDDVVCLYTRA